MVAFFPLILSLLAVHSLAQSIKHLGSSGGNGPKGGLGDLEHPVLEAKSYVSVFLSMAFYKPKLMGAPTEPTRSSL